MTQLDDPVGELGTYGPAGGDDEAAELAASNGSGPKFQASLLDVLRHKREALAAEHSYDLEVPGYGGCLVLRLGVIGSNEISSLVERARSRSPGKEFNANCDLIIRACNEVLGRRDPADELEPIDPEQVTRIDSHLAELFGFEVVSARDVLRELWSGVPSPEVAIGLASAEYVQWTADSSSEVDEDFLGESKTDAS